MLTNHLLSSIAACMLANVGAMQSLSYAPPVLRVLVVDDHAVVRAGLSSALSNRPGFLVCGEASNGDEAVGRYEALGPDVTLMDLRMPGMDGVRAIEMIRLRHAQACIIVLTTFDTDEDIDRAIRAGARGYLLKDCSVEDLAHAIREVHAGRTPIAPAVAAKLAGRVPQVQLTRQDLTVLRLLADGRTDAELAAALAMPESAVAAYLTRLFDKLSVTTRAEAAAAAARRGLVRRRCDRHDDHRATTSVPPPTSVTSVSAMPARDARSCMLVSPKESRLTPPGSNPTPSSATTS